MEQHFASFKFIKFAHLFGQVRFGQVWLVALLTIASLLFNPAPALAHHAMDGKVPANFSEGFLSGLAHPVIGLDHFAFVVAVGLLGAIGCQGIKIPIAFVLAAMAGLWLHLTETPLPAAEFVISGSVLLFGIFLALKERPSTWVLTGLAAAIGLFHGYAYGEAIFGAEMTPLIAYLAGFTAIQLVVATAAFLAGRVILKQADGQPSLPLRFAGFVICGAGSAFLSTLLMETIFPA
ncbi:MAG: HupE/UreJ family protein [Drouetiella hepatica Uher 2000/2452]|jgi:urease accessory protein|uniref:HupE/UreJ family protein n=1 Tax=Drouetiella hepatica Uher 2000/2452 TaxID=904376 RepID=A0A951QG12_9CYAN|nr:HupE/UreJ family protein [Drouetiella hepatica Uher 2000/2452]